MDVIETSNGAVRGLSLGAARAWLGIPYAAPPTGELRFAPPQPVRGWAGIREATRFGAAAPQLGPGEGPPPAPLSRSLMSLLYPFSGSATTGVTIDEDCLVLNVWAPAQPSNAPVMVWFHGGAFLHGAGSEPAFWADRLADRHGVVVVTVNHRLGALGYLHGAGEGSGAAGMLDLCAALEWVRQNIAAFGGDPSRVTVFGQSGGGMKVCALMAMPRAAGLFHRAIVMSGPGLQFPTPEEAAPLGAALYAALDLADGDIDALRALPARAIVGAQYAAMAAIGSPRGWMPVADGNALTADPFTSPAASGTGIPLVIGSTSEETGMFLAGDAAYGELDQSAARARVADELGADAERVVASYPPEVRHDALRLLRRVTTDRDVRVSCQILLERALARTGAPVFSYLFDYDTEVLGGRIGAAHSVDLAFAFDNADRVPLSGVRADRDAVATAMASAFAAFARTGDPSTPLLPWHPATDASGPTMVFDGAAPGMVEDAGSTALRILSAHPSRLFPRA